MSSLRAARTLLLTLALAVGLAGPAVAAGDKGRDAAGDVRSRGLFVDTPPRKPEPQRRIGDIVRYKATYGDDLVVVTKFRHLPGIGDQEFSWFWRTADDEFEWYASLVVPHGGNKGTFTVIDPEANQLDCGRVVLDRPRRTVTLKIPASCLGDPAWVKVAHGVRVYTDEREYADDARRVGVKGIGGWKFGPKLAQ